LEKTFASFCCFVTVLIVIAINVSPIEAQSGLNPLVNLWKMGEIIPGIPLEITQDVDFPGLTGQYQVVGRTSFYLKYSQTGDPTNPLDMLYTEDIYLPDGVTGPREFMIWVYYPGMLTPLSEPAPYFSDALASAMETEGVIADAAMFEKIHLIR
jgi:hypothetical protein